MPEKLRIGVIFGGRSGEHAISLLSARSIVNALDPERYEVVPIAITQDGKWMALKDAMRALESGIEESNGVRAALLAEPDTRALVRVESRAVTPFAGNGSPGLGLVDVIFPVLHGTFGEDGTVQGLLELAGIPYVGAGVAASAVGMDKILMKAIFKARGFPIVDWEAFLRTEWEADASVIEDKIEKNLGYPCFVKPANLGSSVGVSKVHDRMELAPAIRLAAEYDRKIVVEKGVQPARELECAVLGNDRPEASGVGEIKPCNEFYDYEAKYVKDDSELLIPSPIPDAVAERVRSLSKQAFLSLDLAGLARVDFLYHEPSGALYLNEVNTLPGFTRISMYPKLWEAAGLPYPKLVDRLIELALERHAEKSRTRYTFTR